jgi:hypothetical protein
MAAGHCVYIDKYIPAENLSPAILIDYVGLCVKSKRQVNMTDS